MTEIKEKNIATPPDGSIASPLEKAPTIKDAETMHSSSEPIKKQETPAVVNTSIKLTGRMLNFTRLWIQGNDLNLIKTQLQQKLGKQQASQLPVVVSCNVALDLPALWQLLWDMGLQPIGLVTGIMDTQAKAHKIAIFPADGQRLTSIASNSAAMPAPANLFIAESSVSGSSKGSTSPQSQHSTITLGEPFEDKAQAKPEPNFTIHPPATSFVQGDRVCDSIVRSGQSINHVGGDLILTKGLNAGAEAITDYSLHVYGKAEGRLVAGATGDSNARIFCLRFNPSLVSVAGTYCLRENIPTEFLDKAVQVSYDAQQGLVFQLINL